MKFSGLLEKFEVLINLIINSNVFIIFMLFVIALALLKLINKINNKNMAFIIYFIELVVLGVVIYEGKGFLVTVGNKLIDNIFMNFYFPSVYVYLFVFFFSIVSFIYTLLNRFISKIYKIITNTYFLIFNFIFVLLLSVIAENNINIFDKTSLFTNNDILVLLEISTLLFFIYLVLISLVYFTNAVIMFVDSKKVIKEKYDNEVELVNPILNNDFIDNNIYSKKSSVSFQELVKGLDIGNESQLKADLIPEVNNISIDLFKDNEIDNNKEYKYVDPELLKEPFCDDVIKMNDGCNIEEKLNFIDFNILESLDGDNLTLNDYKVFSDMLKTVVKNNDSDNMSLTDILGNDLLSNSSSFDSTKIEKILNSCLN